MNLYSVINQNNALNINLLTKYSPTDLSDYRTGHRKNPGKLKKYRTQIIYKTY